MTAAFMLFVIVTGLYGAGYAVNGWGGDSKPPSLTRDVHGGK